MGCPCCSHTSQLPTRGRINHQRTKRDLTQPSTALERKAQSRCTRGRVKGLRTPSCCILSGSHLLAQGPSLKIGLPLPSWNTWSVNVLSAHIGSCCQHCSGALMASKPCEPQVCLLGKVRALIGLMLMSPFQLL